jgi:hypothetical protein
MGAVTPKHHVLDLKVDQTFASHAEEGPSWIDLIIADHPPKSRFAVGYVFRAVDEQVDSVATVAVASKKFLLMCSPFRRMFPDLLNCHKIVKCGAPRGLIPTVLLEPGTLLGSR